MALGTITRDEGMESSPGHVFVDRISFAGDGSYPTGGTTGFEALVRAQVPGDRTIIGIVAEDCGGYLPVYDAANDTLKVYHYDYDAASDGAAIEVPNTTDLSATTFNLLVLSQ